MGEHIEMATKVRPTYDELLARVAQLEQQQERQQSLDRERLLVVINSLPEAIVIADLDGRLAEYNDEFVRYHRFKDRDECSRTIADCPRYLEAWFADGTPAPPEQWAMARALRGETASDVEYRLRRKESGETWWGSYNLFMLFA